MKKAVLFILLILFLTGCETQSERDERKKNEEINKITDELKEEKIPEEAQQWLIDTKMNSVVTIYCLSTSTKCKKLEEVSNNIKTKYEDIKLYFYKLDEIEESLKNVYKNTYELSDYTGYLPYISIIHKENVISTHTDTLTEEEFINYLKENKIITEE